MTEIFNFLSRRHDNQWLFIDGSIVKAHQNSSNIANAEVQAIGKSRGGNSIKIHLVENVFLKMKQYRAIATRYDKLARNYHAMVSLAFSLIWLPMWGIEICTPKSNTL